MGAGGLGSPALAYLAGAGIGYLGIIDDDIVDISNLHRQVIHSSSNVGRPKVESAKKFIQELNSNVYVECYSERLTNENSFTIFEHYDLILDCTDSPATRYLVNDTAVLLHIPIVSASALKTEGQICVLNYKHGPCYRCLFPIPPPPDSVLSCGDGGIIGPIVGIMGVSQSIEAIKLLTNQYEDFTPYLGIYSAYSFPPWRYIRMRGKKPSCIICGDNPTITKDMIVQGALNYSEFCGKPILVKLDQKYRISAEEFEDMRKRQRLSVLDVREPVQFKICSLPDSKSKSKFHISIKIPSIDI